MKYIDIHGHINFAAYDADREAVIARAKDAGVGIISVGTDLESSRRCVELAEAHEDMWAIVGLHPTNACESFNDKNETGIETGEKRPAQSFDYEGFKRLAQHPKVVAIGECGLDYFHSTPEEAVAQKSVFRDHIRLANEVGKPLMLHVRNAKSGGPNAYAEAIDIIRSDAKVKADFHFFAGSESDLDSALEAGRNVSFTGVLTFARNYDGLVKKAPLDRIMTETDCPYLAPIPYRGKRNEPMHVIEVVKMIAKIRGEDEGTVAAQLVTNAKDFFGI